MIRWLKGIFAPRRYSPAPHSPVEVADATACQCTQTLEKENMREVQLVQALLGTITPNFRMVTIDFRRRPWDLAFYLAEENDEDREEIDDLQTDYDALIGHGGLHYQTRIIVGTDSLPFPSPPVRVVFKRKERPPGGSK